MAGVVAVGVVVAVVVAVGVAVVVAVGVAGVVGVAVVVAVVVGVVMTSSPIGSALREMAESELSFIADIDATAGPGESGFDDLLRDAGMKKAALLRAAADVIEAADKWSQVKNGQDDTENLNLCAAIYYYREMEAQA